MAHYSEEWWYANDTGTLATNQRAIVFGPGDQNTVATIYSDAGLTTPLANPTVTDPVTGVLDFYVPDDSGTYWIFVGPVGQGDSVEWSSGGSADNPVLTVNGIAPDGSGNVEIDAADVDAIPNAIVDAKGDLITATAADTPARLAAGADGLFLKTNSAQPTGLEWAAGGGGGGIPESLIDAKGDLIAGSAPDTAARVPVGTNGQYLRANSGAAAGVDWDTITAAEVGADPAGSAAAAQAAAIAASLQKAANLSDLPNPGTARTNLGLGNSATRNVGTTAGTVAAGDDSRIVGAIQGTIVDAKGDLIGASAADTPVRVPVGTDGQFLRANSGTGTGLEWDTLTAADVGAVAAVATPDIVYGTTTAGAVLNREISTIASPDTVAWRTSEEQLRATTVADGDPDADPDDLTNRAYVVAAIADFVPDSRQILATNGLTGGGDLSADRTIEPVYGTAANTVAEGDDARIVGAIQSSIFNAKADILSATADNTPAILPASGGSDGDVLTLNSSESTGLEWVTPTGGGISPTIFDAKGDILAASAADTPAIRSVGADGTILIADSAQATGLRWGVLPSAQAFGLAIKPRAGLYAQVGAVGVVRSSKAVTLNAMYLRPFVLTDADTLTAIAWENTNSTVGALARLGVYGSDAALEPDARIVDFGTFTSDTTGLRAVTGLSQALSADTLYWLAIVFQTAAPNVRHDAGYTPWVSSTAFPTGAGAGWNSAYVETGVSGALPANTGTIVATDSPALGAAF